jgi:hypothetical protein
MLCTYVCMAWRGVAWDVSYRIPVFPSPYRVPVSSVERESTVFEQDIKAEHRNKRGSVRT